MTFYAAAKMGDLEDGCRIAFQVEQKSLLLVQDQGNVYIIENRCPHMDAPLHTGTVNQGGIVCRAHGICFNLQTGKAAGPLQDTLDCLEFYPVAYDGALVGIEI